MAVEHRLHWRHFGGTVKRHVRRHQGTVWSVLCVPRAAGTHLQCEEQGLKTPTFGQEGGETAKCLRPLTRDTRGHTPARSANSSRNRRSCSGRGHWGREGPGKARPACVRTGLQWPFLSCAQPEASAPAFAHGPPAWRGGRADVPAGPYAVAGWAWGLPRRVAQAVGRRHRKRPDAAEIQRDVRHRL